MRLKNIRALSFDLDDTLWPFRACVERAENVLLQWLWQHAPVIKPLLTSTTVLKAYRARAEIDHPQLLGNLRGLRLASIRSILADGSGDVGLADRAYEVFFEERLRVDLYADVLPVLEQFSQRFPLVALSNGNGCVHKAGIGRFFKRALNPSNAGVAKPNARAFRAAARAAGVELDELLHIGDDWALDVQGALDAGAQSVLVVRDSSRPLALQWGQADKPCLVVQSLHELLAVLPPSD